MKKTFLSLIKIYQIFVSPVLGRNCRFWPSCSEYTRQTIQKDGIIMGCWRGTKRILKCHPGHPGGVDLP